MKNPYINAPATANWRRSVAGIQHSDVNPASAAPFGISDTDKVMSAGSCFAQHISRYLSSGGFHSLVTEKPHALMDEATAKAWNYGTFTARYGNIYVPRQLKQLFMRAYGQFSPAEDIWQHGARHIDPFRPEIQPNGFASRREYEIDRANHFKAVREAFESLDVFIFTLGLTEAWISREDGAVFPLCPGVSGGTFDPARHVFHNFTVDEIATDLADFARLLRGVNPAARIILTVSPVPLVATASGKHVLAATTYSKAVLRVAASTLELNVPDLYYFPSYEIISGAHAKGMYFGDDLRSVRPEGVDHVMRVFFKTLTGSQATQRTEARTRQVSDLEKLTKLACEEESLDKPV